MTYPFIAVGLTALFVVYIVYLLFFKKDKKQLKDALLPGLIFISVWIVLYIFLIK